MNLWQLRKLSTNENLNEPQPLPENWGGIFGLHGFKDRIGDLTWLGSPVHNDTGWFETDIPVPKTTLAEGVITESSVTSVAKALLAESDWAMMPDVPMTAGKKQEWEVYRKALREIKLQPGFPENVSWPAKP